MKRCVSAYSSVAKTVSLNIPAEAKKAGTALRWRQIKNSGTNYDVWMLDDIVLTSGASVIQNGDNSKQLVERVMAFSEDFDTAPNFPYVTAVASYSSFLLVCLSVFVLLGHFLHLESLISFVHYSDRGGNWLSISGGSIAVPDCGGIDVIGYSSRAAFFAQVGQRFITTQPLDLQNAG